MIGFYVVGALVVAGGLAQAIHPRLSWALRRWSDRNVGRTAAPPVEPTSAMLLAARISGVAVVVIGIALLVVGAR